MVSSKISSYKCLLYIASLIGMNPDSCMLVHGPLSGEPGEKIRFLVAGPSVFAPLFVFCPSNPRSESESSEMFTLVVKCWDSGDQRRSRRRKELPVLYWGWERKWWEKWEACYHWRDRDLTGGRISPLARCVRLSPARQHCPDSRYQPSTWLTRSHW